MGVRIDISEEAANHHGDRTISTTNKTSRHTAALLHTECQQSREISQVLKRPKNHGGKVDAVHHSTVDNSMNRCEKPLLLRNQGGDSANFHIMSPTKEEIQRYEQGKNERIAFQYNTIRIFRESSRLTTITFKPFEPVVFVVESADTAALASARQASIQKYNAVDRSRILSH